MEQPTDRERVLNAVTMRDVIKTFCPDIKINRQNRCACPIHGGSHNNMRIYDDTNSFYCFVCGTAGDPIRFVAELENIPYRQAIQEIGSAFGMNLKGDPTMREIKQIAKAKRKANAVKRLERTAENALQPLKEQLGEVMCDVIRLQGTLQDLTTEQINFCPAEYAELKFLLDEAIYNYECIEDQIIMTQNHYDTVKRRIRGDIVVDKQPHRRY